MTNPYDIDEVRIELELARIIRLAIYSVCVEEPQGAKVITEADVEEGAKLAVDKIIQTFEVSRPSTPAQKGKP